MLNLFRQIKHTVKLSANQQYRNYNQKKIQLQQLKNTKRYQTGFTNILGKPLKFVDAASCLFIYQEIFDNNIYQFETDKPNPYIIDAGANIGLSVIYFKQLFPAATIVAFEPDTSVASVLKENIQTFSLNNVQVIEKALWKEETELLFESEGADAGRLEKSSNSNIQKVKVQTTLLSNYLANKTVDFLKIDIEGAEFEVLQEALPYLNNVSNIFVEYHSFTKQEQYLPELLNILKSAGFRLYVNSPGFHTKAPLVKCKEYLGMDMQLNIYGKRLV